MVQSGDEIIYFSSKQPDELFFTKKLISTHSSNHSVSRCGLNYLVFYSFHVLKPDSWASGLLDDWFCDLGIIYI